MAACSVSLHVLLTALRADAGIQPQRLFMFAVDGDYVR